MGLPWCQVTDACEWCHSDMNELSMESAWKQAQLHELSFNQFDTKLFKTTTLYQKSIKFGNTIGV